MDTGATISGISENLAIELGYDLLQHGIPQDFDTAGGTQPLSIITVKQIDFAGSKYRDHKVLCNEHFDNMFIDGVIGLDILMNYNIDINFDKNFIEFYRRHKEINLNITP
ncbi:retropepsin-like domain-containing protein [Candidatus Poribacteria bacterium]|nr:retropepsin-like domain-containing protein [Candidatus Poribacteria bacterium]